ncbi:hypothetical protein Q1695_003886 [Nippostrongylus brasiliensis]|nr:hypothetical protein Q1695_003886 [Nippostrongylus brasiliensis]
MSAGFKCQQLLALPRFHEVVPPPAPFRFYQRLVIASKHQIAVAVASDYELIAFRSSIAHQPANDAKVQTKLTTLEPKGDIKTIGLNADETLLGVLASTSQGCFVFVYDVLTLSVDVPGKAVPLSMIRIGQSASKGVAFEWNPALTDIFAASDDDRTLSVAKIDLQNSSKYSVVGEKKLEAIVNEISWSPKGKQLVVGDMRGKIYQLKPELELVRTTNPPENAGNVAVMNLSWLSTTDWLVAYSNPEMTNSATFMLSIKKDKPPSWTSMNWPTQSSLGITRRLLVDWNVALVVLPCSTDLILVSKPASATAWSSGSVASLQRPSPNVFVVGVAVDLSNEAAVVIGDGTSRRVPVVTILNSDGSVLSYQLSPPSKDYPDCSVSPSPIDISKITNGLRPSSPAATTQPAPPQAPTPATTAQPTSLFGGFTPKTAVVNPQTTSLFGGLSAGAAGTTSQPTSLFGGVTTNAAENASKPASFLGGFGAKTTGASPTAAALPQAATVAATPKAPTFGGLFGAAGALGAAPAPTASAGSAPTPVAQQQPSPGVLTSSAQPVAPAAQTPPTGSLFGAFKGLDTTAKTTIAQPPISSASTPQISLTKLGVSAVPVSQKATPAEGQTVAASKESEEAAVSSQKESAKKAIEAFATEWHEFHKDLHAFAINLKKATGFIEENVDSLTHTDNVETLEEIQKMVVELEDEMNDMQDMLAERKATVEERMALAKEYKDSQIIFGRDPLERAQSEQVLQRYEDFTLKLHEAKKLFAETKNIPSSYKPRQISEFDPKFGGRIQESLKKLSRFSEAVRSRVDDLERKTAYLKSLRNADALNESLEESSKSFKEAPCSVFAYVHSKPAKLDRSTPRNQLRARLLDVLRSKTNPRAVTKKLEALTFECSISDDTLSSSFLNASNIESNLTQKITSPMKARSVPSIRNMGTQADMPVSTVTVKSSEAQPSSLPPSSTLTFGTSKPAEEKKLFGTGIVPVSTSTPIIGSKFGTVPQKAGSSLFPSALSEKQPQNAAADGLGSKSIQAPTVSQSGGGLFGSSSLFKGMTASNTPATATSAPAASAGNAELDGNVGEKALNVTGTKEPTAEQGEQKEEKQNFTFGLPESSTAKESTTLTFGNICSPNVAKKEEKPTSIFGGQGAITIGKKEEKPSSIFGGLGTSTVKDGEKNDEKQSSLFKEESNSEKKEEKTTSLFGGAVSSLNTEKKPDGRSSMFGGAVSSLNTEKKPDGQTSIFGGISSTPTTEKNAEKPTSIFGSLSTTPQKPVEVVETTSTSVEKPAESTPTSGEKIDGGNTLIGAASQDATKIDQTAASQPASNSQLFGSIFGSKPAVTAAGDATSTSPSVTFSFKPKAVESAPAASVSSAFNFASKPAAAAPSTATSSAFNFSKPAGSSTLGFAAAAASAAASAEGDEGMDDDGASGSVSQSGGNIFGGGFLSGFGSATSANANKNVFGGTSSLLKNAAAKPETSSIFSKPAGQSSIFGSGNQTSSFASAAQKAAQSTPSPNAMSTSVFGAAPKFGGPPVFGAKPAFGAPAAQPTSAFGGGAAPSGGGFSAFSGNKSLFGGVSSGGGSSLFGGGMSNQNQPKTSSLFGGGQQASSFSTWR